MNQERDLQIITTLAGVGRPPILTQFRRDSCIASTRLGIDVLGYFGIQAIPVPLFMLLFNDEALKMMEAGASQEEISTAMKARRLDEPGGPWSIGVGAEIKNSSGWAGHLLIGLPQYRLLVDLSFDQAARPHKGLTFGDEGLIFPVPDDKWWLAEERRYAFTLTSPAGERAAVILDRACPDPEGYLRTKNWRRDSDVPGVRRAFKDVTGEIIRLVKQEVGG